MEDARKDTGYAWVVCGASFFYQMMRGGLIYTAGILFIMFKRSLDAEDSSLALITSLHYSVSFIVGPLAGMLVEKYGDRKVAVAGSVLATIGLACSSLSSQVMHLIICYSIINAVGVGMTYNPSLTLLSKYFKKRKRLATGIASCGSGIGSLAFPHIIRLLEEWYGWRGTLLLLAGINAHSMVCAALFRPFPQPPIQNANEIKNLGSNLLNEDDPGQRQTCTKRYSPLLKSHDFICLCLHSTVCNFSTTLVYTHLGNYTLSLGYQVTDVTWIYSVMGGFVCLSRLGCGILPDIININSFVLPCIAALLNGILTMFFPMMTPLNSICIYGIAFAVLISAYNSLCAPMASDSVPEKLMPTAYGIICMFCVPGVIFGAPLAAYIYESTSVYAYSFYLASSIFFLSGVILIPTLPICKTVFAKIGFRQVQNPNSIPL